MHSQSNLKSRLCRYGDRHGFALVVALVLMGLLLLLILSLSALTRVELQTSDVTVVQAKARNNALFGLQEAIGQLQQYLGPDRAVSGTAALLDSQPGGANPDEIDGVVHPAWVGVWTPDDVPAQAATRGSRVQNVANAAQTWLVSGSLSSTNLSPRSSISGESVTLAKAQTSLLNTNVTHPAVLVPKVELDGGSYAYWVSDEGGKANLTNPSVEASGTGDLLPQLSQKSLGMTMVGVGSFKSGDFVNFVSEKESNAYDNIYALSETALLPSAVRGSGFDTVVKNGLHDLTVSSMGLLTNTRSGGLRQDLSSLLAEGSTPPAGRIFPKQGSSDNYDGGPLWKQLQSFINLASASSPFTNLSGELVPYVPAGGIGVDELAISPVVVRLQYYHTGIIVKRGVDDYALRLYYMPALVLWNPYNLPITAENYHIHHVNPAGGAQSAVRLKYTLKKNSSVVVEDLNPGFNFSPTVMGGSGALLLRLKDAAGGDQIAFEPGEIKVFSMAQSTDQPGDFYLSEGFYGREGFYSDIALPNSEINDGTDFSTLLLGLSSGGDSAYDARLRNGSNQVLKYVQNVLRMSGSTSVSKSFVPAYGQYDLHGLNSAGYPAAFGTFAELVMPNAAAGYSTSNQNRRRPWLSFYNPLAFRHSGDSNIASGLLREYPTLYLTRGEVNITDTSDNYNLTGYQIQGVDKLVLIQIADPDLPLYSLGQLQHAQLRSANVADGTSGVTNSYSPMYGIGNSLSNPNIELDSVLSVTSNSRTYYDTSYLLNDALWDGYFFSSINHGGTDLKPVTHKRLSRIVPEGAAQPGSQAYTASANYGVHGALNVNSTSVQAWKALLASFMGVDVKTVESGTDSGASRSPMLRLNQPLTTEHSYDGPEVSRTAAHGFRALSDEQLEALAVEIVREVKERGPFLDLASFVNRSIDGSASEDHQRSGAIQAAIDSKAYGSASNKTLNAGFSSTVGMTGSTYKDTTSMNIPLNWGMPGFLTQADVLSRIGHMLSARSDTFKIRVFGEAKDALGNSVGKAYGEAIVQRLPEYVDPAANNAWDAPPAAGSVNGKMGRRFVVISFRWLNESEI